MPVVYNNEMVYGDLKRHVSLLAIFFLQFIQVLSKCFQHLLVSTTSEMFSPIITWEN